MKRQDILYLLILLIMYNVLNRRYKAQQKLSEDNMDYPTHTIDFSFFLVSKTDGQVLDYIQMPSSQNDLSVRVSGGGLIGTIIIDIVKHAEGFLLCTSETDTVFLYYIRDKKTGEVYRQRIVMSDYKGKEIIISADLNNFYLENGTFIELDLSELKQAYDKNKLSGKLKKLVATLNEEEDNNVFMFVKFK